MLINCYNPLHDIHNFLLNISLNNDGLWLLLGVDIPVEEVANVAGIGVVGADIVEDVLQINYSKKIIFFK